MLLPPLALEVLIIFFKIMVNAKIKVVGLAFTKPPGREIRRERVRTTPRAVGEVRCMCVGCARCLSDTIDNSVQPQSFPPCGQLDDEEAPRGSETE